MSRQVFGKMELTKEETESSNDKAEAHHRQTGPNPGQQGSLGREVDAGIFLGKVRHFDRSSAWLLIAADRDAHPFLRVSRNFIVSALPSADLLDVQYSSM
jgi:hypothetical protein